MTTIAYARGVMASDSGSWIGSVAFGWAEKLARGPDGTLYGVCGNAAQCETFLEWVRRGYEGEQPMPEAGEDNDNSFIVLVAPRAGKIELITAKGREKYAAPYFAIGAGASVAMGALWTGVSADQAVEAAVAHGEGAIGPVRSIRHAD